MAGVPRVYRDYHVMKGHAYYLPTGSRLISMQQVVELSPGIYVHADDPRTDDHLLAEFEPYLGKLGVSD